MAGFFLSVFGGNPTPTTEEVTMARSSQQKPMFVPSLPQETAQAARAVFSIENLYLAIGDGLHQLLEGLSLSELDSGSAFHPETLTRLALLTVFQYAEDLSDRSACTALDRRMDWKYALHLPIQYPSLDPALLCRFRQPLVGHEARLQPFQSLLDRFAAIGLFGRGKRDVAASGVLEQICRLNQLDRFQENLCQAIEVLACHQPDMLRTLAQPHWYDRYREGRDVKPHSAVEQKSYAQALGADALHVLQTVTRVADSSIKDLPEVRRLAEVWAKQCQLQENTVVWREAGCELCPWLAEGGPR